MRFKNGLVIKKGVIVNGFKLAGIYDAIRSGKSSLQSIGLFNDIMPLADSLSILVIFVILYNYPMI